jgi:hypothetical protein
MVSLSSLEHTGQVIKIVKNSKRSFLSGSVYGRNVSTTFCGQWEVVSFVLLVKRYPISALVCPGDELNSTLDY